MIRLLAGTAALVAAGGCGDNLTLAQAELSDEQLAMLDALADIVLPPDADTPGGAQLGARTYIAQLVVAFDTVGAPAIYCDGPFSDRNPFPDLATGLPSSTFPPSDFARFVELDRVTAASWQLFVLGGDGPNGKIVGLRDQLVAGLDAALAIAGGQPAATLTTKQAQFVFDALPPDFQSLVIDLVSEAAFAAPEYGGNPGLAGWKLMPLRGRQRCRSATARWNGSTLRRARRTHRVDREPGDSGSARPTTSTSIAAHGRVAFLGGRTFS